MASPSSIMGFIDEERLNADVHQPFERPRSRRTVQSSKQEVSGERDLGGKSYGFEIAELAYHHEIRVRKVTSWPHRNFDRYDSVTNGSRAASQIPSEGFAPT